MVIQLRVGRFLLVTGTWVVLLAGPASAEKPAAPQKKLEWLRVSDDQADGVTLAWLEFFQKRAKKAPRP